MLLHLRATSTRYVTATRKCVSSVRLIWLAKRNPWLMLSCSTLSNTTSRISRLWHLTFMNTGKCCYLSQCSLFHYSWPGQGWWWFGKIGRREKKLPPPLRIHGKQITPLPPNDTVRKFCPHPSTNIHPTPLFNPPHLF